MKLHIKLQVELCIGIYVGVCVGVCVGVYAGVCAGVRTDICRDICRSIRGRSGSITDTIYRVRDELLNRGIGELGSTVLGGDIQH